MPVTHSFSRRGQYNVTVTAQNLVSSKKNTTYITIEEDILRLGIIAEAGARSCGVTRDCHFHFSLLRGSDFVCKLDYGDGSPEEHMGFFAQSSDFISTTRTHVYGSAEVHDILSLLYITREYILNTNAFSVYSCPSL